MSSPFLMTLVFKETYYIQVPSTLDEIMEMVILEEDGPILKPSLSFTVRDNDGDELVFEAADITLYIHHNYGNEQGELWKSP